jgi:CheY-like chemotaxis protein
MPTGKTILVVDDDPDVRFLCKTVLEAAGYTIKTADNGESGIAMAEAEKPDLIILDIIMERIDTGYAVAEKLGPSVPIMLFSSITNESDQIFDPKTLPVRAVVGKPIEAKKLVDKVREILG